MFRLIISYVTVQAAVQIILPKNTHDETVMQFTCGYVCRAKKYIFFSFEKVL